MNPSDFRAILLDVDRTLTNSQGEVTARTREAVRKAQSQGWQMALCTGRGVSECLGLFSLFPHEQTHVLCAGAQLATGEGKIIWEERIPSATVQLLCERAIAGGAEFGFCQGSQYFASPIKAERKQASRVPLGAIFDLSDWSTPLLSIEEVTQEFVEWVSSLPGLTVKEMVNNHGVPYLDITVGEYTKAIGAARWAERHNLTLQEIIAVGDGDNDTDVVSEAGWGVAMENAAPQLKSVAQQVIGHCDEDGLAVFLEGLTLQG